MGRNTNTGAVLENMVLPALKRGGYSYRKQVVVGARPGGGKHKVDLVAEKSGQEFLISMKWQQSSGTAEQKVPFEIICLAEAVGETPSYKRGYAVLGGPGWTVREYYVEKIQKHLVGTETVKVFFAGGCASE
ncbi:MAG TPA: PD-(D/E)XK nuclease superfamily protein [Candidatus Binataceae bacterium]